MKLFLEEMKWPEVGEALKEPNVVILPFGCLEQHGKHLPLNVDTECASHISEHAARKASEEHNIRVLIAPAMPYGETLTFEKYPGTVGFSLETTIKVVEELVRGFISQGFRNILIVNGHFSNALPISAALRKASIDFPHLGLFAVNWWAMGAEYIMSARKSDVMAHACELETSVTMAIQPENVDIEQAVKEIQDLPLSSKWVSGDTYGSRKLIHSARKFPKMGEDAGIMGDPTVSTKEFGEKTVEACVEGLAELLVEIVQSEGKNL